MDCLADIRGQQIEELSRRQRVHAAFSNVIGNLGLPGRHPSFKREWFQLHQLDSIVWPVEHFIARPIFGLEGSVRQAKRPHPNPLPMLGGSEVFERTMGIDKEWAP